MGWIKDKIINPIASKAANVASNVGTGFQKVQNKLRDKLGRETEVQDYVSKAGQSVADYQGGTERALGTYGTAIADALAKYQSGSNAALGGYQSSIGNVLGNYEANTDQALGGYKTDIGKMLGGFKTDTQTALDSYNKGIDTSQEGFKTGAQAAISDTLGKQTGLVDAATQELTDLFQKEYGSNYLERPEVQNAIRKQQEQFREGLQQFKGNAISGGGTIESQLAASKGLGKNQSDFLADLVSEGASRRSNLERDYLANKQGLTMQKAGMIGEAGGQNLNVLSSLFGSEGNQAGTGLNVGTNMAGQSLGIGAQAAGQGLGVKSNAIGNVAGIGAQAAGTGLSAASNIANTGLGVGANAANAGLGVSSNSGNAALAAKLGIGQNELSSMLGIKNDRLAALNQGVNQITDTLRSPLGQDGLLGPLILKLVGA